LAVCSAPTRKLAAARRAFLWRERERDAPFTAIIQSQGWL
jgi:hypothetical protein